MNYQVLRPKPGDKTTYYQGEMISVHVEKFDFVLPSGAAPFHLTLGFNKVRIIAII
jgi:hypothetical protein